VAEDFTGEGSMEGGSTVAISAAIAALSEVTTAGMAGGHGHYWHGGRRYGGPYYGGGYWYGGPYWWGYPFGLGYYDYDY